MLQIFVAYIHNVSETYVHVSVLLLTKSFTLFVLTTRRYLTEYLPSPSTIPVTVSLSIPERDFVVPEVVLRPDDSMATVVRKLRAAMEKAGMKVAEFPPCQDFTVSIIR